MISLDELKIAFVKADKAGNTEDAKMFADAIRNYQAQPEPTPQEPVAAKPKTPVTPAPPVQQPSMLGELGSSAGNLLAGGLMGAGRIGSTILGTTEGIAKSIVGLNPSELGNIPSYVKQRIRDTEGGLKELGASPESLPYQVGDTAAQVAGTAGLGTPIAAAVKPLSPALAIAIEGAGFGKNVPFLNRLIGGAVTGGASTLATGESPEAGAAMGALVPFAAKGAKAAIKGVSNLTEGSAVRAKKILTDALGEDLPVVQNLLKAAKSSDQTTAQYTADIRNPAWQAILDRAIKRDSRTAQLIEDAQGNASLAKLESLVGGKTATEVRQATKAAKENLRELTTPMREDALNRANLGKSVVGLKQSAEDLSAQAGEQVQKVRELQSAKNKATNAYLQFVDDGSGNFVPSKTGEYMGSLAEKADKWAEDAAKGSLDLGQGAQFAQAAAKSLEDAGIRPLKPDLLINRIKAIAAKPEYAALDEVQVPIKQLIQDIRQYTDSNGVLDAKALDAIRKNSVNSSINKLLAGSSPSQQAKAASKIMGDISPLFTDAIEQAGGKGYRQYLQTFASGMDEIAQKNLTGEALRLWKEDKPAFIKLVQGNNPDKVEEFLGKGKFDIAANLSDHAMTILRGEAKNALDNINIKELASKGQSDIVEILKQNVNKFKIPSALSIYALVGGKGSAAINVTNQLLAKLESNIGKETMDKLSKAAADPKAASDILAHIPKYERNRVLRILTDEKLYPKTKRVVKGTPSQLVTDRSNNNED